MKRLCITAVAVRNVPLMRRREPTAGASFIRVYSAGLDYNR
jgi:hypothetical protein